MKLRLETNAYGEHLYVFVEGNAAPKLHFSREGARILAELCCVAELRTAVAQFAEHGTLPPEPPVWPGLSVRPRADGWQVLYRPEGDGSGGLLIASVVRQTGDSKWWCSMHYGPCVMHSGDTPQAAVDTARTWLVERWGLST